MTISKKIVTKKDELKKIHKNLHICNIFCTFVPEFGRKYQNKYNESIFIGVNMTELVKRSLSGAVFVGCVVGSILWNPYVCCGLFFIICLLAIDEFNRLMQSPRALRMFSLLATIALRLAQSGRGAGVFFHRVYNEYRVFADRGDYAAG